MGATEGRRRLSAKERGRHGWLVSREEGGGSSVEKKEGMAPRPVLFGSPPRNRRPLLSEQAVQSSRNARPASVSACRGGQRSRFRRCDSRPKHSPFFAALFCAIHARDRCQNTKPKHDVCCALSLLAISATDARKRVVLLQIALSLAPLATRPQLAPGAPTRTKGAAAAVQ